ncbi:MAG: N-acetylmuramoyl-L-alanine amidase [Clostridiales bacterium]|nr:N-acetylmuramoyl-L-alanine amidase [Clostridiales bacterium]
MSINITKYTSTVNTTVKSNRSIEYIVLHYTAGTTSKSGSAKSTAAYFMGGSAGGSADFIVDDSNIIQYNPDIKNRYCWSVGGSKYTSMSTSEGGKYYNKCTNINSISIEICSNKSNTSSLLASDTDWYFTEAAVANAVELTKYLMEQYGIDSDHVIMHHHVTWKVCPNPWCVNESRLSQWKNFKAQLETEVDDEVVDTTNISINGKTYTVNRILKDGKNYVCLADFGGKGFDVGYNASTKIPTLDNTVNEISVSVDGTKETVEAVNISDYNYCKLRDLVGVIGGYDVGYSNGTVTINSNN